MQIPLALAYDIHRKRLFVGDGWNNRILVFDAHPDRLQTYAEAVAVFGQPDFEATLRGVAADRLDLGVRWGRGITSTAPTPVVTTKPPT